MSKTQSDLSRAVGTIEAVPDQAALLCVRGLSVGFRTEEGEQLVVRDNSFDVFPGECFALVGESGSGKSVTALSMLRLLPYPAAFHPSGQILFDGADLLQCNDRQIRAIRGQRIAMIFQEPMTSLNPLHNIGRQIGETLRLHRGMGARAAREETVRLLDRVGIDGAARRLQDYPHQLSGGQRQRVMIAMALANKPDLLIADEPTTALDVTVQQQILALLKELQSELGMAMLFITHDLGVVRKMADRIGVMQDGQLIETGSCHDVLNNPQHEATRRLINAAPSKRVVENAESGSASLISVRGLKVHFPIKRGVFRRTVDYFKAVDGIDFDLHPRQTLGIVGESGSGKTTLGLALLRMIASKGDIFFDGKPIHAHSGRQMRPLRKDMQIVFQDPFGSLSPRLSVAEIVGEGLGVHFPNISKTERAGRIHAALEEVGLPVTAAHRYPHEFSGGQRQRVAIARALILRPRFVMLDEPTSALDRSIQAQIIQLLRNLQSEHQLSYLFISHDLTVVRALANHILVLKDGLAVEYGQAEEIFTAPKADYTKALLAAALY